MNTIDINAGWSLFPVAVLAGQSTFEMQITSGKFEADLFSFTNNVDEWEKSSTFETPGTVFEAVDHNLSTITLPNLAVGGSIEIAGMSAMTGDGAIAVDKYKVSTTTVDEKTVTLLTFNDALNDRHLRVNYRYQAPASYINIDNKSSAICEAVLEFPVYDDGTDCAKAAEIGHVYVKVFKARVSTLPGMDGSYKSASTFQFTLSALDPKRTNEEVYQIYYIEN